jgi:hypothetical protein
VTRIVDDEPAGLVQQRAELFENAWSTRVRAGHVCVDHRDVQGLVKRVNRATGTPVRRDWRGRLAASPTEPLAVAANGARDVVMHARPLPLTDDVIVTSQLAHEVATALRQALA